MQHKCWKLPVQLPMPDIVRRDILPPNCRRQMVSLNVSKAIGLAVGTATIPHSSKVQSEVSAIILVALATRTTCISDGTHFTYIFYVVESDGCGNVNTVRVQPFETVTEAVVDTMYAGDVAVVAVADVILLALVTLAGDVAVVADVVLVALVALVTIYHVTNAFLLAASFAFLLAADIPGPLLHLCYPCGPGRPFWQGK
jgi:hypothetical protein